MHCDTATQPTGNERLSLSSSPRLSLSHGQKFYPLVSASLCSSAKVNQVQSVMLSTSRVVFSGLIQTHGFKRVRSATRGGGRKKKERREVGEGGGEIED